MEHRLASPIADDDSDTPAIPDELLTRLKADQPAGCLLCALEDWDEE